MEGRSAWPMKINVRTYVHADRPGRDYVLIAGADRRRLTSAFDDNTGVHLHHACNKQYMMGSSGC
jgi:hypothetical protein